MQGTAQQPVQRPGHMTNFELGRLFALTTSPATAAAVRFGGAPGAAAAMRLQQAMAAQRQSSSEGYLRSWDALDSRSVVTVSPPAERQPRGDAQRAKRVDAVLTSLPVQQLRAPVGGDPCAICQQFMLAGEAVRRLPCAHLFHSECIARWLPIRLICPLDNLPVDEGLEMLAAAVAGADASTLDGAAAGPLDGAAAGPPPGIRPPPSSEPPLPSEPPPPPPPTASGGGSQRQPPSAPPGLPCLPPLGLRELQAAADKAGVPAEHLADALARHRDVQVQLHRLWRERGGAPIVLE